MKFFYEGQGSPGHFLLSQKLAAQPPPPPQMSVIYSKGEVL